MKKNIRLIIFGGTGDLARRKLVPSICQLNSLKFLPENIEIVGIGSRALTQAQYHTHIKKYLAKEKWFKNPSWKKFTKNISYLQCDITRCDQFARYVNSIAFDQTINIFYLALAPQMHRFVLEKLGNRKNSDDRIVIEKPFGYDQNSAKELNNMVAKIFREEQIYRIDHYIAKETVQNIIALRFSNGIFEPVWNYRFIDSVQIEVHEKLGVEGRAGYFDKIGIVKDMVQSHLLQLLAIVAMEPPQKIDAKYIRNQKVSIFKMLKPISSKDVSTYYVKGQYQGYKQAKGVAKNSAAPTFAAMKFFIKKRRWKGVPFYLRTGKKMKEDFARVVINFKHPGNILFGPQQNSCGMQNQLQIIIQPEEKICIRFGAKKPGTQFELEPVSMIFNYQSSFKQQSLSPYARLIFDLFKGDQSLFARNDGIENSWKIIDNYEKAWFKSKAVMKTYTPGSFGPATYELFEKEGVCNYWNI